MPAKDSTPPCDCGCVPWPLEETSTDSSLDDVFEAHADRVYGFALKRCGRPALAEDVTALAFEAASRRFSVGQGHEVTLPWLLTVARRRLVDHWRAEARRADRLERMRSDLLVHERASRPDGSRVVRALDSLPMHHRAALVLRYLDELSVSEVAEELEMTYKATESLLSRARRGFSVAYWEQS